MWKYVKKYSIQIRFLSHSDYEYIVSSFVAHKFLLFWVCHIFRNGLFSQFFAFRQTCRVIDKLNINNWTDSWVVDAAYYWKIMTETISGDKCQLACKISCCVAFPPTECQFAGTLKWKCWNWNVSNGVTRG